MNGFPRRFQIWENGQAGESVRPSLSYQQHFISLADDNGPPLFVLRGYVVNLDSYSEISL